MKWIEVKMRELGVLGSPNFKIMQLVDHGAMITVQTEKYGMLTASPRLALGQVSSVHGEKHHHVR